MSEHIPIHTLTLYQKPKAGTGHIASQIRVLNYKHRISAIGGFDVASFDIAMRTQDEGDQWIDQFLGNWCAIYIDNTIEPAFEGFINRLDFDGFAVRRTISLDEMANRMTSTHTTTANSPTPAAPTTVNDTASQAIYGIKQEVVDLGHRGDGTGASTYVATQLAQRAWPLASIVPGGGSGLLHVELQGAYHTLEWEIYRNTATTNVSLTTLLNSIRSGLANGATFFDNTDTSLIGTNATNLNQEKTRGSTAWETMMEIREQGDGANYWVIGITPTNWQTGKRRLYYRQFNPTIKYTARLQDNLRVRDLHGVPVPPWAVQPDNGIRITDQLMGWAGVGDDPLETWIMTVNYDANSQTVTWQGDDDRTAEGVFQQRRYGKKIGRKSGGSPRRLV